MLKIIRGSVASYALVAGAAAALSALATWQGTVLVTPSAAQPAAGGVQQIVSQPLADVPGREVRMSLIQRAPGFASPPHRPPARPPPPPPTVAGRAWGPLRVPRPPAASRAFSRPETRSTSLRPPFIRPRATRAQTSA